MCMIDQVVCIQDAYLWFQKLSGFFKEQSCYNQLTGPIKIYYGQIIKYEEYIKKGLIPKSANFKTRIVFHFYSTVYLLDNYLETYLIIPYKRNKCLVLIDTK